MKNQYPLGGNRKDDLGSSPDPKQRISANDISAAIGDESINERPSQVDVQIAKEEGAAAYGEDDYEAGDAKARFKDENNKGNLLNDMRMIQEQKKAIAKVVPKKKKEGEGEGGAPAGNESGGDTEGTADTAGPSAEEKNEDEKFLDEDTGSVASSTKSLAKHLRMLRNALYENYLPPSINNLKINAKIVFVALLIITIVWYVYSKNIYK